MIKYSFNNKPSKELYPMSNTDRILSSLFLDIPISEIDIERSKIVYTDTKDISEYLNIVNGVYKYKDFYILPSDNLSFKSFCSFYLLKHTIYNNNIDNYIENIEKILFNLRYIQVLKKTFLDDMDKFSLNNKLLDYCNVDRLIKALNKEKIKASIFNNKLLVEFNNIELVGTENIIPVKVVYDKIYLYIVNWEIEGFVLRFKNFDYSSYWGFDLSLHPKLILPNGWNGILQWCKGDYPLYAEALRETITEYNPATHILEDTVHPLWLRCRQLFAGLKYSHTSRVSLSKEILSRAEKEIQITKIKNTNFPIDIG